MKTQQLIIIFLLVRMYLFEEFMTGKNVDSQLEVNDYDLVYIRNNAVVYLFKYIIVLKIIR